MPFHDNDYTKNRFYELLGLDGDPPGDALAFQGRPPRTPRGGSDRRAQQLLKRNRLEAENIGGRPEVLVNPPKEVVDVNKLGTDSPVYARGQARQGALDVLGGFGKEGPFTDLMNYFEFAVDEAGLPTGSYEDVSFKIYDKFVRDRSDPTKVTTGEHLGDQDFILLRNMLVSKAQSEMHTDPDFKPAFPGDYGWYRSKAPSSTDRAGHAMAPWWGETQENVAAAQELADYIMGSFQPEAGALGAPMGVGGTRKLGKWGRSTSEVENEARRLMERVIATTGQAEREGRSPFISGQSEDIYGRSRRPSHFIPNFP